MTAAADLAFHSALEVMRLIAGGELPPPPIAKLLGMEIEEVGDGYAAFTLEPDGFPWRTSGS